MVCGWNGVGVVVWLGLQSSSKLFVELHKGASIWQGPVGVHVECHVYIQGVWFEV